MLLIGSSDPEDHCFPANKGLQMSKHQQQTPSGSTSKSAAVSPSVTTRTRWHAALLEFFTSVGLHETVRGFEADLLVLSRAQHNRLVPALKKLEDDLKLRETPEEEDYEELHVALLRDNLVEDATPSQQNNAKIKAFMDKKRKMVNQSNQQEYTRKRQNTGEDESETAARTDAIKIERSSQIKHDTILHQESPHLEKTIKSTETKTPKSPMLDERIQNIESHFNIEYTPRPPASLVSRIGMLEEHIMMLEREHPAWSALHFAQPGRTYGGMEKVTIKVKPQDAITRKEVKIKAREGKEKKEKSSGLGLTKGQSK